MPGICLFLLVTSGCISSGTNTIAYHVLDPVKGQVINQSKTRIGIGPVDLPEYLDRPHLMIRTGASTLQASKNHRWAAPLDSIITDALKQNLALRLPDADISSYPWDARRHVDRQFIISVHQFIASNHEVELSGRWRLFNRNSKQLKSDNFSYSVPIESIAADAVVNGMAIAISRLSDDLAR